MATSAAMSAPWEHLHVVERGAGPAVLLVHGQPGLCTDWDPVADRLVADHRVVVPDRPGYGGSGRSPLGMAENADALAGLLRSRGVAPSVVVGHSYGGGVGVLLAARHPDAVRGLVLVGSVGDAGSVNGFDHLLAAPLVGPALSAMGLLTLGRVLPSLRPLARHLPDRPGALLRASLPDRQYAASISRLGLRMCRSFVAEQRSLIAEIGDVQQALPTLGVPTVVVTGTWDAVVPPSVAQAMAAAVPHAELVTVARTGHFVPRDAPRAVVDAVRRVVARSGS